MTPGPSGEDTPNVPEPTSNVSAPTITFDQGSATLNETSMPPLLSLIGVTLDGRYSIQRELGQGGVGAVYLAGDRKLPDKPVVIRVLLE
ncbi:MAG TPA: hypothetical protein VF333_07080, partial [Pyrinomonadaceae bacterium]